MEDIKELEEMRRQIALLNKKIEKETLVSDRLMRRIMKTNISVVNRSYAVAICLSLFGIPYCYWTFGNIGMPVWFRLVTAAFFIVAIVYTFITGRDMRDSNLMNEDLLEVRRKVAKARKAYHDWLKFGIPALVVWLACFFCLVSWGTQNHELMIGGGIGIVIGLACGLKLRRKTIRAYREIIEQIDDVAGGK